MVRDALHERGSLDGPKGIQAWLEQRVSARLAQHAKPGTIVPVVDAPGPLPSSYDLRREINWNTSTALTPHPPQLTAVHGTAPKVPELIWSTPGGPAAVAAVGTVATPKSPFHPPSYSGRRNSTSARGATSGGSAQLTTLSSGSPRGPAAQHVAPSSARRPRPPQVTAAAEGYAAAPSARSAAASARGPGATSASASAAALVRLEADRTTTMTTVNASGASESARQRKLQKQAEERKVLEAMIEAELAPVVRRRDVKSQTAQLNSIGFALCSEAFGCPIGAFGAPGTVRLAGPVVDTPNPNLNKKNGSPGRSQSPRRQQQLHPAPPAREMSLPPTASRPRAAASPVRPGAATSDSPYAYCAVASVSLRPSGIQATAQKRVKQHPLSGDSCHVLIDGLALTAVPIGKPKPQDEEPDTVAPDPSLEGTMGTMTSTMRRRRQQQQTLDGTGTMGTSGVNPLNDTFASANVATSQPQPQPQQRQVEKSKDKKDVRRARVTLTPLIAAETEEEVAHRETQKEARWQQYHYLQQQQSQQGSQQHHEVPRPKKPADKRVRQRWVLLPVEHFHPPCDAAHAESAVMLGISSRIISGAGRVRLSPESHPHLVLSMSPDGVAELVPLYGDRVFGGSIFCFVRESACVKQHQEAHSTAAIRASMTARAQRKQQPTAEASADGRQVVEMGRLTPVQQAGGESRVDAGGDAEASPEYSPEFASPSVERHEHGSGAVPLPEPIPPTVAEPEERGYEVGSGHDDGGSGSAASPLEGPAAVLPPGSASAATAPLPQHVEGLPHPGWAEEEPAPYDPPQHVALLNEAEDEL